jgi:signal transduction histidine kinase
MADDMESPQTQEEQSEKAEGRGFRGGVLDQISALHGRMRLDTGFSLDQAISEYRALRSSILFLWMRSQPSNDDIVLAEVIRFNETIDQAIAELVRRYADKTESYGDVFLGILAHELRNPLNIIKLSSRFLSTAPGPEGHARSIERILRGAASIERLTNDLSILVRSRMRVPAALARTDADLGEICDRALAEVKDAHDNTLLNLEKIGDLKGKWDPERLEQVIFNLVVNAVTHGSAKQVQITAEGKGPEVVLRVANQGALIPPDMLESIFDPFVHQERAPSTVPAKGLGLGLFIVREIVRGHDGTVDVTSTDPEGTTFSVQLPRSPGSEADSE